LSNSDDTFGKEKIIDDDKTAETDHGTHIIEEQPELESEVEAQLSEGKSEVNSEIDARNTGTNEYVEDKVEVGEAAKAELLAKLIKIADTPRDSEQLENIDSKETENDENDGRLEDDEDEEEMMPIDQDDNLEIDIDLMGAHFDKQIHVDNDLSNIEIEAAGHELHDIKVDDTDYKEIVVVESKIKANSEKITTEKISRKGADWIHDGIKQHEDEKIKAKNNRLVSRAKSPIQQDHGLAKYINDLHAIGFDEDEIDSMLKEVNIARMSEHVIELKHRVEQYLLHHNEDHKDSDLLPHEHDEKMIPLKHRKALDSRLQKLMQLRREMEGQFNYIGFSLFDTYFYLLLWCSSTFILAWFYCGYNCRICYARRKPIYRFMHHKL